MSITGEDEDAAARALDTVSASAMTVEEVNLRRLHREAALVSRSEREKIAERALREIAGFCSIRGGMTERRCESIAREALARMERA